MFTISKKYIYLNTSIEKTNFFKNFIEKKYIEVHCNKIHIILWLTINIFINKLFWKYCIINYFYYISQWSLNLLVPSLLHKIFVSYWGSVFEAQLTWSESTICWVINSTSKENHKYWSREMFMESFQTIFLQTL